MRSLWRRSKRPLILVVLVLVLLALPAAGLVLAQSHPDAVAAAADWARKIVGPAPVAAAEDAFYRAADGYNRLRYRLTGRGPSWELTTAAPPVPAANAVAPATAQPLDAGGLANTGSICTAATPCVVTETTTAATAPAQPLLPSNAGLSAAGSRTPVPDLAAESKRASRQARPPAAVAPGQAPAALTPLIAAPVLAGEGAWQPLATAGQPAGQAPLLWQTVFRPDPNRPFAAVALVAMDLTRSRLHLMIGTREPVSSIPAAGRRPGAIPAADVSSGGLLAAWNGGFRAIHGSYGIMTDGVTWLPPLRGMQTVALGRDGRVVMGPWGQEVGPDGDWLAWRQNNPPLIQLGQVNPDVIATANTIRWGASIDGAVFIWRSGMGLAGGRWLIYAAGNSLSVATLTAALQAAGCESAMQLDVNASYERFVTFANKPQVAGGRTIPLTATKLIDQMAGGPAQFLVPDDRDFFYLTLK